jgi:excisionase family DNA binding protein
VTRPEAAEADRPTSPWFPHPAVNNAAEYAGCHYKTLLRALQSGECRGYQPRRRGRWHIHRDDVDRWVRGEKPSTGKRNLRAA